MHIFYREVNDTETLKTKSIAKPIIITSVCIVAVIIIALLSVFFYNRQSLKRALADLDTENTDSVIRVMKYGSDKEDVLLTVADAYIKNGQVSDASRLMLYAVQYVDNESEALISKYRECYNAQEISQSIISTLSSPHLSLTDFEVTSEYDGTGYALTDNGIYTEFLGGYAKAKISVSASAKLSAAASGVYFIDLADFKLKLLSKDGGNIKTVLDTQMTDFLNYESYLYYIDINGIPHGPQNVTLEEGTFADSLRVKDGNVICTVYDKDYNKIQDITLS